jgi:chromate reductase, NAD(P)H dehydrogenase (quinone)
MQFVVFVRMANLIVRHHFGEQYINNAVIRTDRTNMYTIISGTNRPGSNSLKVASQYQQILESRGIEARVVSLEGLDLNKKSAMLSSLENEVLIPSSKFIFILPEYNGSFPGSLKVMIDLSDYKKVWWGKKALLTGISSGRAGNLRGMDHLAGSLNFLKVVVHPNKLPISGVDKLLNGSGVILDKSTVSAMEEQVDAFIHF